MFSSQELEEPSIPVSSLSVTEGVGEDVPDDGQPSLEEALTRLGLTGLTSKFQEEQIDFDSLVGTLVT